jgi:hypothetical protein
MYKQVNGDIFTSNVEIDTLELTATTYKRRLKAEFIADSIIKFTLEVGNVNSNISINKISTKLDLIGFSDFSLYQNADIRSGFLGDEPTAYNIPFTPKRILNSFKNYLAICNWKSGMPIKYTSTDINSDLTSILGYESAYVVENADVETDDNIVVFQPINITFETEINYQDLNNLKNDKYRYYQVIEKGTSFKGWVNTAVFSVGQLKKQQWKLQCRSIEDYVPET